MVDHNKLTAACEQVTADYITQAAKAVKLIPIKAKRKIQCEALNRTINVGPITKDVTISGYKKIDPKTKALLQIVKNGPIDSVSQVVFGLWIDIPILTTMSLMDYNNACHTLQHCMLALAPVYVTGALNLSTNCFSSDIDDRRPILMLYDGSGRSGVIDTLLPLISTIIQRSKTLMENCDCEIGCDQCVFIKQCTTNNSNLDRAFGLDLLNALIKEE